MIGDLIDRLCIVNNKLYELCDNKFKIEHDPSSFSKEELVDLITKDIALCRERANLKNEINKIVHGEGAIKEVKNYGK